MGLTALGWKTNALRRIRPELLDTASDHEAGRNLRDLLRIHRYLGGERIFQSLLAQWYRRSDAFRVLDIGCGACPMHRSLAASFPRAGTVSLDRSFRNLSHGTGTRLAGDALQLPFAAASFDVACCNLLLHHFAEREVVRVLREMKRVSRHLVVCIDLERHWAARSFLPASNWLFRWSPVTLQDGPVSVDAGFEPEELALLARRAECHNAEVRCHAPWFRLSLTWQHRNT